MKRPRSTRGLATHLTGFPVSGIAFTGRAALLRRDAVGAAAERARALDLVDLLVGEAEHVAQDLLGVLAEKRRTDYLRRGIRQLDRVTDRDVLPARRVLDPHEGAGRV